MPDDDRSELRSEHFDLGDAHQMALNALRDWQRRHNLQGRGDDDE